MRRNEVRATVGDLVVLDYYQSSDQQIDGDEVEGEMRECSSSFLMSGVRGL